MKQEYEFKLELKNAVPCDFDSDEHLRIRMLCLHDVIRKCEEEIKEIKYILKSTETKSGSIEYKKHN